MQEAKLVDRNETPLVESLFVKALQHVRHFCSRVLRRRIQMCKSMRLGEIQAIEHLPLSPRRYVSHPIAAWRKFCVPEGKNGIQFLAPYQTNIKTR